jgi:hypothetical protein
MAVMKSGVMANENQSEMAKVMAAKINGKRGCVCG